MSKLTLPADLMKKMVCLTCKNYLSCFPVYVKNDNCGGICGRCKITDENKFIHDVAYENIAQFILFPCRYKRTGCDISLTPQKIPSHEKSCTYRNAVCPTKAYTKCQWEQACIELKKHLDEKHANLLLKDNEFELSFLKWCKGISVMYYEDEIFIVKKTIDSNDKFTCSLQHLKVNNTNKQYDYCLSLRSGDKTDLYKVSRSKTAEGNNIIQFSKQYVKEKLNDTSCIIVNIAIIDSNTAIEEEIVSKDIKKDPSINWDWLPECPVCFDHMLPPIFQCIKGHCVCSNCKLKIKICPSCQSAIEDTRNFLLENTTQHLTFPCKFYVFGCTYSAKGSEIGTHQVDCEFGPIECPLSDVVNCPCKYSISEIISHIDNHSDFVMKSDRISRPFQKDQNEEKLFLIKFSGRLFKLYYKYADKKFLWTLQLVGPSKDCKKFKFEIDVIDNSFSSRKFFFSGVCVPLTKKENSFSEPKNYLMIILEQIESMITNKFSYKVRVIME